MQKLTNCGCCKVGCHYSDDENPCWGSVDLVAEVELTNGEWGWIHACDGHGGAWEGNDYLKWDAPGAVSDKSAEDEVNYNCLMTRDVYAKILKIGLSAGTSRVSVTLRYLVNEALGAMESAEKD